MMDELLYTQEDIDEWIRTCEELQERNRELKEELSEINQKIEQGTLIELPCKVGDKVYMVYSVCVEEWEVTSIIISYANIILRLGHIGTDDFNSAWLKEAGNRLFFTREEAEKRLKELQE